MKLTNFTIANDYIALEAESEYYDLHNCFDFQRLEYNVIERKLELCWIRNTGDWVKSTEPMELRVIFHGVYLFKTRERDLETPFTEDDCLNTIGFTSDKLIESMDSYVSNSTSSGCTHLLIDFMSGFSIKIGADSATLHIVHQD